MAPSASDRRSQLDPTDTALIAQLQRDGRVSMADLGRSVSLSASSVRERVRRLTDLGVITGYVAVVDPGAVGYPLLAFARVRLSVGTGRTFHDLLRRTPQILEAHHLTGEDCFLLKIVAATMADLEDLTERLALFGNVTTNLVFSSPVEHGPVPTGVAEARVQRHQREEPSSEA